ncbi:protein involved in gliding motility GldL [Polaribacter sp. KT25b]|uniref:type IX secretion system motor protein PorL/GldL n=1 Tax=Polaribacter sp. KT25b TaxID=1855336 RepID=UPI00087A107C|nr:gliding motility protein GldL [Polaribacter sp. KT25b]SDR67712.1 protein involved in gliding motility GldL [Polaribacter sp. KT25b]
MAQSKNKKKLFNIAYNIGASIVILGALFKLNHISYGWFNGSNVLAVGLIAEALIFFLSAFDTPEDDLDWSKVYPELGEDSFSTEEKIGTEGLLSQKLDALLQEAKIDASLMTSLGNSMKNFQGAAEGLSVASESISSTNKYNEQVSLAAVHMESLNNLYKVQVENSSKQTELNTAVVENTERLKMQMDSLAKNLSSLNGVYGNMLSAMSSK